VLSSFTFLMAKRFIKKENQQLTTLFLIATLLLGLGFVYFQFDGFSQLYQEGLYFAGDQSTVKSSFIYGIAIAHLVHIFAGLIVLIVVLFNQLSKKYSASNYLGLELGAIFWHFVDILCVYLFFFFYFIR
jgi:cytochrome c oxidase subunit 3